ncbi:hypothetical protein HRbin29_02296 [bacterium HR29]|jgi:hypothetical protein|nr:hypothetical protein HRbin29_02296 [bacterium HR29]
MRLLGRHFVLFAAVAAALGVAACGGDGGNGGGSEEQYVRALCNAFATFDRELTELINDEGASDEGSDVAERYAELFSELVDDLSRIRPPSSVREYHEVLTAELRRAAEALERGDFESAFEDESPFTKLPEETNNRLREVARNVEECQGLGLFGE